MRPFVIAIRVVVLYAKTCFLLKTRFCRLEGFTTKKSKCVVFYRYPLFVEK